MIIYINDSKKPHDNKKKASMIDLILESPVFQLSLSFVWKVKYKEKISNVPWNCRSHTPKKSPLQLQLLLMIVIAWGTSESLTPSSGWLYRQYFPGMQKQSLDTGTRNGGAQSYI